MEELRQIFDKYLMIMIALHLFSLGLIIFAPIYSLMEGRNLTALVSAILVWLVTIFIIREAFRKH